MALIFSAFLRPPEPLLHYPCACVQINPISTIRTRYGNSVSTPKATPISKPSTEARPRLTSQRRFLFKESQYFNSVSTPHRRYGLRLQTPFVSDAVSETLVKPMPNMTGRLAYRTMEMNEGSSAPYLARTPCVPLFFTLFNRGGNRRAFRLPGAGHHFHCKVEPSPGHIRCQ